MVLVDLKGYGENRVIDLENIKQQKKFIPQRRQGAKKKKFGLGLLKGLKVK